jgi:ribosomal protein L11 methyltransferase
MTDDSTTQPSMVCVQLTLPQADTILEDVIEGILWDADLTSWEREDEETFSELLEDPRPRAHGSVRWRLYRESEAPAGAWEAEVRGWFGPELPLHWESWPITDLSFLTAWKAYFRPARVSDRIIVHPPWEVPEAEEGTILINIDPGMAFGTGTHETTRLCLRALDRALIFGSQHAVLDVGCGSGILAIAAALLGGRPVVAIDNDCIAVDVAEDNCRINGVDWIQASPDPLDEVPGTFDIVVANILPHVLIELADPLLAKLAPGGALILSGILRTEAEKVIDVFTPVLGPVQREDMGEWCALTWLSPTR